MTSEKSILQNNFEGKKLARIYLGKIMSCTEQNIAQDVYNAEKKSYSVVCQGKNL